MEIIRRVRANPGVRDSVALGLEIRGVLCKVARLLLVVVYDVVVRTDLVSWARYAPAVVNSGV